MISSETGRLVIAGIALIKKDEIRFIVAYHIWESETVDKAIEKTDQDIKELVGGESDIVKVTGSFGMKTKTNRFNAEAKTKNLGF